jgi:hypothetical protein
MNENCGAKPAGGGSTSQCKKKCFMNIDLKRGFRVSASWILKEMLEVSALSYKAGSWTSEQWVPDWLENSGCGANQLKSTLYSLLQGADLQTRIHLWFMHDCAPLHFLFSVWELRVSATMNRTRWTNSMTGSLICFKSLRHLYVRISEVYCLCYRNHWRPGLATASTEGIRDN